MTYPTIKYQISNIKYQNNQQGVTLLLAILVMSAIMAIAMSLASILLVEVKVSGDLGRTEPAIYAANAITEEAMFTIKRGYPRCSGSCSNQFAYSTIVGSVNLTNPAPTETTYNDPILIEKVLVTSNSLANTKNRYLLYNPADINLPGGYASIQVQNNSGNGRKLNVNICEYKAPIDFNPTDSPIDCSGSDLRYKNIEVQDGAVSQNFNINKNKQQELIIYGDSTINKDGWVIIKTFDENGAPKGIPNFGETVVEINARNRNVTRAVRVRIPDTEVSVPSAVVDNVWVEDSLPAGSIPSSDYGDSWHWISSNPSPYTGSSAFQHSVLSGWHQLNFTYAPVWAINSGDKMIAYVYIDPSNLPSAIKLSWRNMIPAQDWNHGAYWGQNLLCYPSSECVESQKNHYMGTLPSAGSWVRLEVPANEVGLEGQSITGMQFNVYNGRVSWDHIGKVP
jgi:hypothetical protein